MSGNKTVNHIINLFKKWNDCKRNHECWLKEIFWELCKYIIETKIINIQKNSLNTETKIYKYRIERKKYKPIKVTKIINKKS